MNNPFAVLERDLKWLQKATDAVLDNWEACNSPDGWDVYWQTEARVRSVERSIRRSMKVYHCVFGGGQSCKDRTINNCDACVPGESQ
jgi:hypothetical protein